MVRIIVHLFNAMGWSEPAATSATVQDKAIQAVMRMNQKHTLYPCPGIFQPPFLLQNFPFCPLFPLPLSSHSLLISSKLKRAPKLDSFKASRLRFNFVVFVFIGFITQ